MARNAVAYTAPFAVFILLTGVSELMDRAHVQPGGLPAMYALFPLQTVICAGLLLYFWPCYRLRMPAKPWLAAAIGVLVCAIWISPQAVLHLAPRLDGFNPGLLAGHSPGLSALLYWGGLLMRFLRLVVVVPALEEIFWRGFLLRYLIDEQFEAIPFGTYARGANLLVAAGFMLEHSMPDWPAALAAGLLYNLTACRTRSLSSCILAHAVTNALLGAYIMATRQWGFW